MQVQVPALPAPQTPSIWIPTDPTELWTMVAAVVSIALLVVAGIGLRSLVLAKRELRVTSEREAKLHALERCEYFAKEIIPRNKGLLELLAANKIPVFVKSAGQVTFEKINESEIKRAGQWVQQIPENVRTDTILLLNDLEAWAAYFVNRIADEKVAFGPCAPVFCTMVTQTYGLLMFLRSLKQSGAFPNIAQLFLSWREQLSMPEVLARLKELQSQTEAKYTLEKPIGTED